VCYGTFRTDEQLLGYLSTRSAVRRAREDGRAALLVDLERNLRELWGPANRRITVRWPISLRIGRLAP